LDVQRLGAKNIPEDILSEVAPRVQNKGDAQDRPVDDAPTIPPGPTSDTLDSERIAALEAEILSIKDASMAQVEALKSQIDQLQSEKAASVATVATLQLKLRDHDISRAKARVEGAISLRQIDIQDRQMWVDRLVGDETEYAVLDKIPRSYGTAPLPLPKPGQADAKQSAGELTGLARAIAAHSARSQ